MATINREMRRLIEDQLLRWKRQATRKPLLVEGPRQVGKTYLIEHLFGSREFRQVHRLDFRRDPSLATLFADSLAPGAIVSNLELHLNTSVDVAQDLIFFDEVGDCQRAVDSLKHFAQGLPQAYLCASCSNVGPLRSFPVGQVEQLELSPLCFEEFLMAASPESLLEVFRERRRDTEVHCRLWSQLRDYFFVGGMPEAVASWFQSGLSTNERIDRVRQIHHNWLLRFERDCKKRAGSIPAEHISTVFSAVPRQLSASRDGSVRGFKFGGVIDGKGAYPGLRETIDWLVAARLVRKCYPILGRPVPPLAARIRVNAFKLFPFDIGLLSNMLEMPYTDQREPAPEPKAFIAESFVQNELSVHVGHPTYRWEQSHFRIEFLHCSRNGEVIPVDVKSGSKKRAHSLRFFDDRYSPSRAIKLAGSPAEERGGVFQTWPLYDAMFLRDL